MCSTLFEENIEWIFNDDCRTKKKTASGLRGRAKRLRMHDSVKMPSEQEPDKFQRKLILNAGPCFTTTLRELKLLNTLERVKNKEMITIEEIKELPLEDGRKIYSELRRMYGIIELQKNLDCSQDQILELSNIFELDWLDRVKYGEWIKVTELKALEFKDGQKIYAELRRLYSTAEMYKGFSCSSAQISELSWFFQVARSGKQILVGESALDVLKGFPENRSNQAKAKAKREKDEKNADTKAKRKYNRRSTEELELARQQQSPEVNIQVQSAVENMYKDSVQITLDNIIPVEVKNPDIDLLRISVKNVYSADQIMAFLTRVQLFVEGQDNQFELSLTLQEKLTS